MKLLLTLFCSGMLLCMFGCEQPKVPLKLSSSDYKVVDSLVKVSKKVSAKEIDSMCNYYNNRFYERAIDSITIVRMDYIKDILE